MTINTKNTGAYVGIVSVQHKKNGVCAAVAGCFAKVGGAYQNVLGGAVPASPNRLTQLIRMTESGDVTPGYTYVGSGTGFGASDARSVLAGHFADGVDGTFTLKVLTAPVASGAEVGIGVDTLPAPASYTSLDMFVVNHAAGYQSFVNGVANGALGYKGAINDLIRFSRTGATGLIEASKNNGTSWTTIFSATVATGLLYVHVILAFTASVGNVTSTGLVVDAGPLSFTPSNYAFTMDGNSLVYGTGSSDRLTKSVTEQLAAVYPFNGAFAIGNIGVAGQSIAAMRARGGYPNASYQDGKNNFLLVWEATNSICNTPGMTGLQAASEMAAYIADRRAVRPLWKIIILTTLPRFSVSVGTIQSCNAELLAFDNYVKANYLAMGADAVVDVRSSGLFTYTEGSTSANSAMLPYMADQIHLNDSGYAQVASMITPVVLPLIS